MGKPRNLPFVRLDSHQRIADAPQPLRLLQRKAFDSSAELQHVVRALIYATNIENGEQVGKTREEFCSEVRPVTSMVEVNRLIAPEMLAKIEAETIAMERSDSNVPTSRRQETVCC
jgi:enamine deaminase RidA (YjgF/YER057c/UK114 family)